MTKQNIVNTVSEATGLTKVELKQYNEGNKVIFNICIDISFHLNLFVVVL